MQKFPGFTGVDERVFDDPSGMVEEGNADPVFDVDEQVEVLDVAVVLDDSSGDRHTVLGLAAFAVLNTEDVEGEPVWCDAVAVV
ncbi:hypothetical protein [Curtobacterium sp. MCPF17_031]|uniref:hypothetical protein n=1 Tax=Curtobacterium sp. MCPF17_031 TaxID=2175653 RepID=UPI000DA6E363|nr:hypothetical protein [Curtobacterium sp. MCPF17_031]PZE36947.1 hypothetical protein DEJ31_07305 [Curtobacterium sp. MCPF17_031]